MPISLPTNACCWVWDVDGKRYLDCLAAYSAVNQGHNHPKMGDPEFLEALARAALTNPANSDIYTREFAGFVKTFREVAVPDEFRYLFFVAGGALAVENAMKTAFDWKRQKNRAAGVEGGGDKILHFREAFHGRSGYTLSVTNTDPGKTRDFPQFDWPRVSNPKLTFPVDTEAVAAAEAESVREIEAAFAADWIVRTAATAAGRAAAHVAQLVARGRGAVAELAIAVVAPAPDVALVEDRAAVARPGAEDSDMIDHAIRIRGDELGVGRERDL